MSYFAVSTVLADGLALSGTRPSASTVMTTLRSLYQYLKNVIIWCYRNLNASSRPIVYVLNNPMNFARAMKIMLIYFNAKLKVAHFSCCLAKSLLILKLKIASPSLIKAYVGLLRESKTHYFQLTMNLEKLLWCYFLGLCGLFNWCWSAAHVNLMIILYCYSVQWCYDSYYEMFIYDNAMCRNWN